MTDRPHFIPEEKYNRRAGTNKEKIVAPKKKQWRKYDWEALFACHTRRFMLRAGKEYKCSQTAIVQQARNYAAANDFKVSVVDGGDRITVVITEAPGVKS